MLPFRGRVTQAEGKDLKLPVLLRRPIAAEPIYESEEIAAELEEKRRSDHEKIRECDLPPAVSSRSEGKWLQVRLQISASFTAFTTLT